MGVCSESEQQYRPPWRRDSPQKTLEICQDRGVSFQAEDTADLVSVPWASYLILTIKHVPAPALQSATLPLHTWPQLHRPVSAQESLLQEEIGERTVTEVDLDTQSLFPGFIFMVSKEESAS